MIQRVVRADFVPEKVVIRLGIEPRTYGLRDCQGGAGGRVLRLKKLRMKAGWGGAGEGVSFYSVL